MGSFIALNMVRLTSSVRLSIKLIKLLLFIFVYGCDQDLSIGSYQQTKTFSLSLFTQGSVGYLTFGISFHASLWIFARFIHSSFSKCWISGKIDVERHIFRWKFEWMESLINAMEFYLLLFSFVTDFIVFESDFPSSLPFYCFLDLVDSESQTNNKSN